jgi:hypothetical protein
VINPAASYYLAIRSLIRAALSPSLLLIPSPLDAANALLHYGYGILLISLSSADSGATGSWRSFPCSSLILSSLNATRILKHLISDNARTPSDHSIAPLPALPVVDFSLS